MTISYSTLSPIDNAQDHAVDIGMAIKPFPLRFNVKELYVVVVITNLSNDFSIVVIVS